MKRFEPRLQSFHHYFSFFSALFSIVGRLTAWTRKPIENMYMNMASAPAYVRIECLKFNDTTKQLMKKRMSEACVGFSRVMCLS